MSLHDFGFPLSYEDAPPVNRAEQLSQLEADKQAFFDKGGKVEQVARGVSGLADLEIDAATLLRMPYHQRQALFRRRNILSDTFSLQDLAAPDEHTARVETMAAEQEAIEVVGGAK